MPQYKSQHYVPRCLLRPFSLQKEGRAINVFNIARARAISAAALKGQCARNYMYGEDLVIEKYLQNLENQYASIQLALVANRSISDQDKLFLSMFGYLQYSRTEAALKRRKRFVESISSKAHEGTNIAPPAIDRSDREMMLDEMSTFLNCKSYINSLKILAVRNESNIAFVTSDNPAVIVNKFHVQRLRSRRYGIGSSGTILLLPMTPALLLICYDGLVYTIPNEGAGVLRIEKDEDAAALNQLQFLAALENVYFDRWDDRDRIGSEIERVQSQRAEDKTEVEVFVPDLETPAGISYKRAVPGAAAPRKMLLMNVRHPTPSRWPSFIRFRDPVKTYSNGSAVGHVRRPEWLSRR